MILLFEGHTYKQDISQYLSEVSKIGIHSRRDGYSLSYVGYFYNKTLNDIVLILPKVFIYNEFHESEEDDVTGKDGNYKAFGRYSPDDLLEYDTFVRRHKEEEDFKYQAELIYGFSTWVYQAIRRYNLRNPKSKAVISTVGYSVVSQSGNSHHNTLFDLIMSLKKFAEENQSYFIYIIKNCHSGFHKINWKKTIAKSKAFISNGVPFYINPITKRKQVNYDEELLVILFSTLHYIQEEYGIKSPINENYSLMNKKEYSSFCSHAKKHLEEIKRHYFSDKTLELWNLLYDYYCKCDSINSNKIQDDLLLVNNFHVVFEDMIDYLLSDNVRIPKELKEQSDGKRVDHIYRDTSLVYDDEIFYIGDSKYYKEGKELEEKSIAKQYTYAKNIIQRNIDVLRFGAKKANGASNNDYIPYRDDLTEGYNITPNFFISGVIDNKLDFNRTGLEPLDNGKETDYASKQFPNRLFDRDTLILQRYNINFLYVLSRYARNRNVDEFKSNTRITFKDDLTKRLDKKYEFFQIVQLNDKVEITKFLDKHFRTVYGKVFSFKNADCGICLLMALEIGQSAKNIVVSDDHKKVVINKDTYAIKQVWLNNADKKENSIDFKNIVNVCSQNSEDEEKTAIQWYIEGDINEELKYTMYLPLYEAKAACGIFLDFSMLLINEPIGWVYAGKISKKPQPNMLVVTAVGDSMEPTIHNGDYCVFQKYGGTNGIAGERDSYIVLAAEFESGDIGRCLIKKYIRPKIYGTNSGWEYSKEVILRSLNKKYKDIKYDGSDDSIDLKTAGIFVDVIRPENK